MDLATLDSACNVYPSVESVSGMAASSASLTDMYILRCKPGTTFSKNPVTHIFVKLSVSASSVTPELLAYLEPYLHQKEGESKAELLLKRLSYSQTEYSVYEVVKQIYYSHMCPFFIRVYGVGFNCSYSQVGKFLKGVKHNLKRNIFLSLTNNAQRPAIHEDTKEEDIYQEFDPRKELRFNLLLLQYVEEPSFLELLAGGHYQEVPALIKMLFMVGYACYALNLNNLCHRDLHLKNVLVEHCKERTFVLVVETNAYKLQVTEFPRLFDFDRSKQQPCATSAQDLFYFVGFFAGLLPRDVQLALSKCFFGVNNPFTRVVQRLLTYWKQPVQERPTAETSYLLRQLEPLPSVLSCLATFGDIEAIPLDSAFEQQVDVFIARRDVVDAPDVREAFLSLSRNQ